MSANTHKGKVEIMVKGASRLFSYGCAVVKHNICVTSRVSRSLLWIHDHILLVVRLGIRVGRMRKRI